MSALTPEQIDFEKGHIDDDRGPMLVGVTCMFLVLTSAAIGARLAARKMIKLKLSFDDYCIFVAQVKSNLQGPRPGRCKELTSLTCSFSSSHKPSR